VRTSGSAKKKNIWMRLDPFADQSVGVATGGLIEGGVDFGFTAAIVE